MIFAKNAMIKIISNNFRNLLELMIEKKYYLISQNNAGSSNERLQMCFLHSGTTSAPVFNIDDSHCIHICSMSKCFLGPFICRKARSLVWMKKKFSNSKLTTKQRQTVLKWQSRRHHSTSTTVTPEGSFKFSILGWQTRIGQCLREFASSPMVQPASG